MYFLARSCVKCGADVDCTHLEFVLGNGLMSPSFNDCFYPWALLHNILRRRRQLHAFGVFPCSIRTIVAAREEFRAEAGNDGLHGARLSDQWAVYGKVGADRGGAGFDARP